MDQNGSYINGCNGTLLTPCDDVKRSDSNLYQSSPILTDAALDQSKFIIFGIFFPLIAAFGVLSNILNIIVFKRLGLKDSISVCYLCLSCSDLVCLLLGFGTLSFVYLTSFSTIKWPVKPSYISYLLIWYYLMFYDISMVLITFIAIQRCCCVAFPLKFRDTFTKRRVVLAISGLVLACIALNFPLFTSQGLQELEISNGPNTRERYLTLWQSDNRYQVLFVTDLLLQLILPSSAQVIVFFCLVVMIMKLRESASFRLAKSSAKLEAKPKLETIHETKESSAGEQKAKENKRLTGKEHQAATAAAFVSFIFIACNSVNVVVTYAVLIVPELNVFRAQHNLYIILKNIKNACEFINISVNALVYYKFNTRYRNMAKGILCRKSSASNGQRY